MLPEADFYRLLTPQRVADDRFQARSLPLDSPAIFGGQLMAQALAAGSATLDEERPVHYLQANFVAPGNPEGELDFQVTRLRDGGSTSHRQVLLTQDGKPLLTACLSFQVKSAGFEHQVPMPAAASPEALMGDPDHAISLSEGSDDPFPFTLLACPVDSTERHPESAVWATLRYPAPQRELLHQMLFAFFSDVTILQSALNPHALDWRDPGLLMATMNHSIWFHRTIDISDWLLYDSESPSTSGGRALSVANAFDRKGALLATVAQEGVLRQRPA